MRKGRTKTFAAAAAVVCAGATWSPARAQPAEEPPESAPPPTLRPAPAPPLETPPSPAEVPSPPSPQESQQPRLYLTVRGLGEATMRADIDGLPADVAVYRTGLGLSLAGPLSERVRLSVNLDGELSFYEFRDAFGILESFAEPIPDAWRAVFRPQLAFVESREFSWFIGGIVESGGVAGAKFSDTITGGGFGGVRFALSENFAVSLGAGVKTRLEESALVIPLLGFEWKINDRLTLASDGLDAALTAQLTDSWAFRLTGGWELREYRLPDDGPVPSGVVRDWRVPVGAGFLWTPAENIQVELLGGVVAWQEYRFDNSRGNRIVEVNTDPTGFVRLSARITF